jgi:cell division protein FtsZ
MLDDAHAVIVHVSGPPSLSFSETAAIMREASKHVPDNAHLFLSVSAEENPATPLSVTIFGTHAASGSAQRSPAVIKTPRTAPAPTPEPKPATPVQRSVPQAPRKEEDDPLRPKPPGRLFADENDAPALLDVPSTPLTKVPTPKKSSPSKAKQETLQFESATRGRFEKSEPTIVEGEDLDVPTFLRARQKTP